MSKEKAVCFSFKCVKLYMKIQFHQIQLKRKQVGCTMILAKAASPQCWFLSPLRFCVCRRRKKTGRVISKGPHGE